MLRIFAACVLFGSVTHAVRAQIPEHGNLDLVVDYSPHPVAVRWWGQALVTIETYWNLTIAIDPYDTKIGYDDPGIAADLVLVTHDHFDHNNVKLITGDADPLRGLDESGEVNAIDVYLDRPANVEKPVVFPANADRAPTEHAVRIRSIPSFHDDEKGAMRGSNAMFLIEVNNVRIVHCGDLGQSTLTSEQLEHIRGVDVLILPVGGVFTIDGKQAADIVKQVGARYVIPIHYKTPSLTVKLNTAEGFLNAMPDFYLREEAASNTLAVSEAHPMMSYQPTLMVLKDRLWNMPGELVELFDRKERAARESMKVFQPLSVKQMNHRPSDGTHTPRWNAEHMMGRELGFFSAVYYKLDPNVPHLDLNPDQMPEDYSAAHADWDGAEEARQIERVQALTRRFAYLLHDVTDDALPEGAPRFARSLSGLFQLMEAHYGEHTANVKKKFALPDWPAE